MCVEYPILCYLLSDRLMLELWLGLGLGLGLWLALCLFNILRRTIFSSPTLVQLKTVQSVSTACILIHNTHLSLS